MKLRRILCLALAIAVVVVISVSPAAYARPTAGGIAIPAATKKQLAAYDEAKVIEVAKRLDGERARVWEETHDPAAIHQLMLDNGYELVGSAEGIDSAGLRGDVGINTIQSNCARTVSVYISPQDGTTVISATYHWSSYDNSPGSADRLWIRFYNAITNPNGGSPYLAYSNYNYESLFHSAKHELLAVETFQGAGGGVIWALTDKPYQAGGSYATDNGSIALTIPPQTTNSVYFGMTHTWSTTSITGIGISVSPTGVTSINITFNASNNYWTSELQKSMQ